MTLVIRGTKLMVSEIQTCGYEGLSVGEFVERLAAAGTKTVIDVRANPLSRKPGLSKNALAKNLEAAGIAYLHVPKMGCPKPIRDRYKLDRDWAAYTKEFLAYLSRQGDAVALVAAVAARSKSCLVCFEADFNFCHRTFVARAAARLSRMQVTHLTDQKAISDQNILSAA
jgi:uncharacterized protein (DUF488 family)